MTPPVMHTPWSHTSNAHTYMAGGIGAWQFKAGGQGQGDRTPADRCFRHWNGITTTYFATICGPCQILLDEGKVDRRLEQHSFQGTRCERPADAVAIEPVAIVPATTDRESLSPQQPALDNVEAGRTDAYECSLRMLVADQQMFPWARGTCIHPGCEKAAIGCHIWARSRMVRFGPREERQDRDDRKVHFGPDNEDENMLPGCNDHNQAVGDSNHQLAVRADYKERQISEGTEYDRAEYYCRRWLKWMSSYRSRAIEEQEALNVAAATRRRKRRNSAGWRKGLGR